MLLLRSGYYFRDDVKVTLWIAGVASNSDLLYAPNPQVFVCMRTQVQTCGITPGCYKRRKPHPCTEASPALRISMPMLSTHFHYPTPVSHSLGIVRHLVSKWPMVSYPKTIVTPISSLTLLHKSPPLLTPNFVTTSSCCIISALSARFHTS